MNRIITIILLSITLITTLHAHPQYSLEENQPCLKCHQNMSGGGMRNLYGAMECRKTSIGAETNPAAEVAIGDAAITKGLIVGADFKLDSF